jgi:hypothetical protein
MGMNFFRRIIRPWYHSDTIYRLSPLGIKQRQDLAVLHGLTRSVIRTRKQELLVRSKDRNGEEDHEGLGEEF